MEGNPLTLIPVLVFLLVTFAVVFRINRRATVRGNNFVSEYFIGNRSLGGFVLAMTTIATYGSVSSFVGGPGQAWSIGWGWVYMSTVQVTALFLLFGILGKKLALISRRIGAVTIIDVLRARYKSDAVANISAVIILLFFAAMMVAQFVGGAKLFESVTGYSYVIGLLIFGIVVISYTTVGGFRGVAVTDAICGIMMIVGIVILAAGILVAGGGYENIMQNIMAESPTMMDPLSDGQMPIGLYVTQWLLVGVLTFCLPQSVVRCLGFRDEKALKNAMVVGTVIIGLMMICVTALGVLAKGVLPATLEEYGGSVDNIIPLAISQTLPAWLAGIAIVGPIAASISTVSSLLISSSSSIIKDMYMHHCEKQGRTVEDTRISGLSRIFTYAVGLLVLVIAIAPPDVIWKINMFAFGGLETAFCWAFVMGLFWKRAHAWGALASMIGGVAVYCITMALGFKLFDLHQIVIGASLSLLLMLVFSWLGDRHDRQRGVIDQPDGIFFVA